MIDYESLFNLHLGDLRAAVEAWDKQIRILQSMDTEYTDRVFRPFDKAGWSSTDFTSTVARMRVAGVNKEFNDAVREAQGIRGILCDTHDKLRQHKEELHRIVEEDARKSGLAVGTNSGGYVKVTPRQDAATDPDIHDEGERDKAVADQQAGIDDVVARIEKVLRDATDTEESAAAALRRNLGKKSEGFNDKVSTSLAADETARGKRASHLLKKLDSQDGLSQSELKELERLMDEGKHSEKFSQKVLKDLGPEGTLKLADKLDQIQHAKSDYDKGERNSYASLERDLADNIGTANQDEAFSEQWRKDMRELGAEPVDGNRLPSADRPPLGYQALSNLLKHGSDYPPHMMTGLTDDMIEAEKKDPNLWDSSRHLTRGMEDKVPVPKVKDPVDDMLGIMSRDDPHTATQYLDPESETGKGHLQYLLKERDWPNVNDDITSTGEDHHTEETEAPNNRRGFGDALRAATTGDEPSVKVIDPDGKHTAAQARIMRDVINNFDGGPNHEEVTENLRQPLAKALAGYTGDTHEILTNDNDEFSRQEQIRDKHGKFHGDGLFSNAEGSHVSPDRGSLIRFMRGLSEEPDAYGTIRKAETAHIAEQMDAVHGRTAHDIREPAERGASVLGTYDAIRDDTIRDKGDDANAKTDWDAKVLYHVIGAPVTPIKWAGDGAQRLVDMWTTDMANEAKGEMNDEVAAEIARRNLDAEREMQRHVADWADTKGPGADDDDINKLQRTMDGARYTQKQFANEQLGR
ncbi:hypothetical protein [Streptomyces inhibens]|uniref:hypothetical protein n=1 Tax=Streptomyces inhibens TaxID=2293571 RepID=UPI001EE6BFC1|nr:hypothetical protein [Streptomyces inhibens]UKY47801.1 hypothetical protein KI385_02430 [Streptomyces inhibens]